MTIKKIKTTLLLALCAIALTGCNKPTPEQRQQYLDDKYDGYVKTVNYRGHSYILYSEYRTGGGITHDPDCPCRKSSEQPLCTAKKGGNNATD